MPSSLVVTCSAELYQFHATVPDQKLYSSHGSWLQQTHHNSLWISINRNNPVALLTSGLFKPIHQPVWMIMHGTLGSMANSTFSSLEVISCRHLNIHQISITFHGDHLGSIDHDIVMNGISISQPLLRPGPGFDLHSCRPIS